jgi:hypothetical protein
MNGQAISFNGNSLQTANIITADIQGLDDFPIKQAKQYTLSHQNQSVIPYINYPNRNITITGMITDTSIANLDARMDTFKSYFTAQDVNLDIAYNGTTRRFIATQSTSTITRPGQLLYATFSILCVCNMPFGQDTSATSILNSNNSAATYSPAVTFLGTAPYQLPIITITFSANYILSGGAVTVWLGNNATGQVISINRIWAITDVLVVDCTQNTVTVNGFPVEFSGAFPVFIPGSGTFIYGDGFSTRTFTITINATTLYL